MAPTTAEKQKIQFPDLEFTKLVSLSSHPLYRYFGFAPGKQILPAGHVRFPGCRAFPIDVILESDIAIPMRDTTTIYADIFRPANSDTIKVPAIIPWSPYGKTGTGVQNYEFMAPFSAGIPKNRLSGYEKFEAPDPAEWCERGYAIINVDARGAGASEGNIAFWGMQEAEDIYDTVEWLVSRPWCNGSIAMAGNSWLAIAQINFASRLHHPAVKALAPMEALNDPYRQVITRGGKPHNVPFHNLLIGGFAGENYVENMPSMCWKHPLYDSYWESKRIHTENIENVPLYLLASYSTGLHSAGSFDTFRTANTKKWLRIHPYQEWYDLYRPEINDELQRFFDRYCKGLQNGWEDDIPPVRLSLLGFENSPAKTIIERPESEYPLARQKLKTYYMDASSGKLVTSLPSSSSSVSHESHHLTSSSDFTLHFDKYTELAGYPKIRVWVSCNEKDDMDIVVQIRKIDGHGNLLQHLNYPCPVPVNEVPDVNVAKTLGPQGALRASHAVSRDDSKSIGNEVYYQHDRREPIKPGSIIPLEISLWPIGMVLEAGEGIMLRVSGHDMSLPEVEIVRLKEPDDENVGMHVVHTGGQYDSCLIIPIIT